MRTVTSLLILSIIYDYCWFSSSKHISPKYKILDSIPMEQEWCLALTALTERKTEGLLLRFDRYITDRLTRSETSVIHLNLVAALAAAQIIFLSGIEATQNTVILRYSYLWIKSIQRPKSRKQD